MNKITLGVIGAGRIGSIHAGNLARLVPGASVKTIAEPFLTDEARKWIAELGVPCLTKDYRDILKDEDIEAVLICSSTDTHALLTRESAKAGKHVFCEKPIDLSPREIRKTLEAVEKGGIKLQVGFNRRFDPHFMALREGVVKKKVGDLHMIKITSRDPGPPPIEYIKKSGGMFMDMTIHDIDMVRFLSGSDVDEVFAYGDVKVDEAIGEAGDIDTAIVTMKLKNGVLAVIDNSREAKYGYDQRGEVFGSKGAMAIDNELPHTGVLSNSSGVHGEKPKFFFLERYREAYVNEMGAFIRALQTREEVAVGGIDGLNSVLVAEAAVRSLKSGRSEKVDYS